MRESWGGRLTDAYRNLGRRKAGQMPAQDSSGSESKETFVFHRNSRVFGLVAVPRTHLKIKVPRTRRAVAPAGSWDKPPWVPRVEPAEQPGQRLISEMLCSVAFRGACVGGRTPTAIRHRCKCWRLAIKLRSIIKDSKLRRWWKFVDISASCAIDSWSHETAQARQT